ncbi:MAG: universal stress protein [Thermodesulfobacteriota bacterium]
MERHVLISVGEGERSFHGVRFYNYFFADVGAVRCTLLYLVSLPPASRDMVEARREEPERERRREEAMRRGQRRLDEARDYLRGMGFPAESIQVKLAAAKGEKARDILAEGVVGDYDAVVLGRRGLGWLEELVETSVTRQVYAMRSDVPVWICRFPEAGREGVLLCADGSDSSLRMADHVGFMLADLPRHRVRVLHVFDPAREEPLEAEDIVEQAAGVLEQGGLAADRITCEVVRGAGMARIIAQQAAAGNYAAVAIGRTGAGLEASPLRRLFLGSVSLDLFRDLSGPALWFCH